MQYGRTRLGARVRRAVVGLTAAAAVAGAVATTGLVGAAPAGADVQDWEVVEALGSFTSDASRETIAACPSGKELIGTGASIGGAGGDATVIESIVPDLANDRVVVTGYETPTGTEGDWRLKAYAVCADDSAFRDTYVVEEAYDPGILRDANTRATCDAGDTALAVGFATQGPRGRLVPNTLRIGTDHTQVVVQEDVLGTAAPWTITAYALCAGAVATDVRVETAVAPLTNASCDPGEQVIGAGAKVTGGLTGYFAVVHVRPATWNGFHFANAAVAEMTPTSTDPSQVTYAVCADLP